VKKKVLVCGGTGFIGSNLVRYLSQCDDIELYATYFNSQPQNEYATYLKADLRNLASVHKVVAGKDVVIQAAGVTSGANDVINRPYIHVTDNAIMNAQLLQAIYEEKVKHFLFFSCTVMYPSSPLPLKEEDVDLNADIYSRYFGVAWTKIYIEKLCRFYSEISDINFTVIRHTNIYGPGDKFDPDRSHVFASLIRKVTEAQDTLHIWGDGREKRDLLHINDLCAFVRNTLDVELPKFDTVNVGLGKMISILDLADLIIKASGKKLAVIRDEKKASLSVDICLDTAKAASRYNWRPKIELYEGIQSTLEWYQQHAASKANVLM